jgi:hypothetical protein
MTMMKNLVIALLLLTLPVLVASFSLLAPPTARSNSKRLLRPRLQEQKQLSELFSEEIAWAQEQELKVQPNDAWIVKEFNSDGSTLAKQHHEWFSEAIAAPPTPVVVKPVPPLLGQEEQTKSDLHEWFAEEIEWLKKTLSSAPPAPRHHHEWFSEGVARQPKETSIRHTPLDSSMDDIQKDHQREWFGFQLANPAPAPLASPPPAALPVTKENIIGREWFSNGMNTMKSQASPAPSVPLSARTGMNNSPSEWFSQVLPVVQPPVALIPRLPTWRIANAGWFYQAMIMDDAAQEDTKAE